MVARSRDYRYQDRSCIGGTHWPLLRGLPRIGTRRTVAAPSRAACEHIAAMLVAGGHCAMCGAKAETGGDGSCAETLYGKGIAQ